MKNMYHARVAAGLCGMSNCDRMPVPGRKMCQHHADEAKAKSADARNRRKAAGMCIVAGCNEKAAEDRTRCLEHLKESSEYQMEKTRTLKAAGYCAHGGPSHGPVKEGCTLCQKCLDEHYESRKKNNEEAHP